MAAKKKKKNNTKTVWVWIDGGTWKREEGRGGTLDGWDFLWYLYTVDLRGEAKWIGIVGLSLLELGFGVSK